MTGLMKRECWSASPFALDYESARLYLAAMPEA
jgi:hypothetical protein